MYWCGQEAVVFLIQNNIILIDISFQEGAYDKNSNFMHVQQTVKKGHFCVQELDGLRIITNRRNEMLIRLPDAYLKTFNCKQHEEASTANQRVRGKKFLLPRHRLLPSLKALLLLAG